MTGWDWFYYTAAIWGTLLAALYLLPSIIWAIRAGAISWGVVAANLLLGWMPPLYIVMVYNAASLPRDQKKTR